MTPTDMDVRLRALIFESLGLPCLRSPREVGGLCYYFIGEYGYRMTGTLADTVSGVGEEELHLYDSKTGARFTWKRRDNLWCYLEHERGELFVPDHTHRS